ncbi:hypothetical protein M0220_09360 [Halomonas qinghailakensis]|uniref:Uncharacterized protein n=2 Tax=Halomonas TaxID=2745 RepID=A0AA46TMY8_9GAMM|nr:MULTISPECIES: hypothetical protein [Halomonas]UYO73109.1 hypothetical protein M0220_09360 [Halomonas sp. ZZQ-149]UYV18771.1 hypothetical protein K1Y77_15120 [Halomonas qaidamensis]
MKDLKQINLRNTNEWLSGDIDIRVPKKWLVIAAAVFVILVLLALN